MTPVRSRPPIAPPAAASRSAFAHGHLEALSQAAGADGERSLGRILATAREQLDMEIAYVTAFRDGQLVHEVVEGDGASFGLTAGTALPLGQTICSRVVDRRVPEALPDVRAERALRELPVIDEAGIGSYIGVPITLSSGQLYGTLCCISHEPDALLSQRDARFMHVLAGLVAEQLEREQVERENRRLQVEAAGVGALLAALDARDHYTGDHSEAVVELAAATARQLKLPADHVGVVEQVALLHDVGKVGVPDSVLQKPGPLDDAEWAVMRTHPEIGERIVAAIDSLAHLAPAIRAEHERWDGGGYPDGLAAEEIPIASRIVLACDAYHAMTSDRPYRRAMSAQAAVTELRNGIGSQFCPETVPALLQALVGLAGRAAA